MADKHPSSPFFSYLNRKYKDGLSETNDAYLLLSMRQKTSLEELMTIYDEIFKKFIIYRYGEKYWEIGEWYNTNKWAEKDKEYLQHLNYFLNDEIYRIYRNHQEKGKFALRCLVNLRLANNYDKYLDLISKESEKIKGQKERIKSAANKIEKFPLFLTRLNKNSPALRKYHTDYGKTMKILSKLGYIKSIIDKKYESEISIREKKIEIIHNIILYILAGVIALVIIIPVMEILSPLISLLSIPFFFFLLGSLLFAL